MLLGDTPACAACWRIDSRPASRIARHPGGGALQLGAQRGDVGLDQGHQLLDLHPYFYTFVP